ncbi:MAG: ABC transporter permease [Mesorhizobium sp.]|nr:MAG: ABC transporter permease [Mesorhizobium sp.]TIO54333.1 MAG: ABC transporter permease [Mesorhizobium sp.]TIO59449.1 MAG: ABC transporter permease [Mesorhizobium sp.]TJV63896.1 MAG: ABC transporter permease [Mesorhizobium sp.]
MIAQPSPSSRLANFVAIGPGLLFVLCLFIVPLGVLALRSITDPHLGFGNYDTLVTSPTYLRVAWRTIWISVAAAMICAIAGTPVAYSLAHSDRRSLNTLMLAVLVLSFLTSSLIRTFSWMVIFGAQGPLSRMLDIFGWGPSGLLGSSTAVIVGMVHFLLPVYILTAFSGLRKVPYHLVAAAEGLGASRIFAVATVYLPLAMPSIVNAGCVVFIIGIGFFITPALLGGPRQTMLAQLIARSVTQFGDFGFAAAGGVILLAITLGCLWIVRILARGGAPK